jgi:hypothetical protein
MEKWKKSVNSAFIELGRKPDVGAQSLGLVTLLKDALLKGTGHISECLESGNTSDYAGAEVLQKLQELNGRLIYKFLGNGYSNYIWLWNDSIVEFEDAGKNYFNLTAASQNEQFIVDLRKLVKPYFKSDIKQGSVYAIVSQGGRLALSSIGNAGIPLVRLNYNPSVIESYDFVIKDLKSSNPSGRIVIMEGEPGTGKTHLVRAMLMDVKDAMFVLVSPEMVSSLAGPEFLPLLLSHKYHLKGPIILILEDADKCLVTRDGNNINSIQSLLNLSDGIVGSLLDLRIIATTNANKLEMEKAILRPGRLSKRLEVNALDAAVAANIFKTLVSAIPYEITAKTAKKLSEASNQAFTLADVYGKARDCGWNPVSREDVNSEKVNDPRTSDGDDEEEDY